jgi:hypothetical protein
MEIGREAGLGRAVDSGGGFNQYLVDSTMESRQRCGGSEFSRR